MCHISLCITYNQDLGGKKPFGLGEKEMKSKLSGRIGSNIGTYSKSNIVPPPPYLPQYQINQPSNSPKIFIQQRKLQTTHSL
jgi:hypothetical protein